MNEIPVYSFALREDLKTAVGPDGKSFVPSRATNGSTGWDFKAALTTMGPLIIRPGMYVRIPLGFRVFAPAGWWLECRPRSSSFAKKNLHCLYGVIDEDYEGECLFVCQYIPDVRGMGNDLIIEFGESIGQLVPVKRQDMVVEQISNEVFDQKCKVRNAQRGAGGFGSTSK